ncbi:uncharacterized protein LOC142977828 isoform X2 [Anticarsia gemmatalis]|uniref:uncharacterized protein LOC142977828 isoform X2 n=1 Tax=Anticarsia gemmatalis TaxID=129554 RepID=UPI003F7704C4
MSFFTAIPLQPKSLDSHQSIQPWEKPTKHIHSAKKPSYLTKKEIMSKDDRVKLTVIGNIITKEFIYCLNLVKGLYKYRQRHFQAPIIRGVTGVEWPKVWSDLKRKYGALAYCLKSQVAILIDDQFLGGENELKDVVGTKYIYDIRVNYYQEGIKQFANYIKSLGRSCAYLHISVNDEPIGVLIFMLYSDVLPRTCENFLRLCETKKGGYGGTPIHRIVKDCWIQCGGYGLKSNPSLNCENFSVPHDRRGVLCMANDGSDVDCSTQFFVLLQPAPWMEHKYVAFGQLIEGESTLKKIENVPTWYEAPMAEIKIFSAGVLDMDCQRMPINKNTNAYIQEHIEDLNAIGEISYGQMLERVFNEIDIRRLLSVSIESAESAEVSEEQEPVKNLQVTQRFLHYKDDDDEQLAKSFSDKTLDVFQYEFEDYAYTQGTASTLDSCDDKAGKIVKPFYIPLTDVPYPGEVDSDYNLQKLLKGDYCLESDLENDAAKRMQEIVSLCVPEQLLDALFECNDVEGDDFDSDLDEREVCQFKNYLRNNADKASFAGPVLKKMAQLSKKFEIFDDTEGDKKDLITDEELRLIRIAAREMKNAREKMVSISALKLSHSSRIKRRQTGFVHQKSLDSFIKLESTAEMKKKAEDDDDNSRPYSETHSKFKYLTDAEAKIKSEKLRSKLFARRLSQGRDRALDLQHGTKVTSKISSDYVDTLARTHFPTRHSLRAIEYAKKRPSMTVAQYHQKNQQYQEKLKYNSEASINTKGSTES